MMRFTLFLISGTSSTVFRARGNPATAAHYIAQNSKETAKGGQGSAPQHSQPKRATARDRHPKRADLPPVAWSARLKSRGKRAVSGSVKLLFSISRNPKSFEAAQLKYMLGLMLMELKLHQVASFVFYDVIDEELKRPSRDGKYLRQALGKLSYLSNVLESDVLLKYAVSRIRIGEFPEESRDLFFYRYGELKLKEGNNAEAAKAFRASTTTAMYPQALYKLGLAYAEDSKLKCRCRL